jgi:hypothetical protein
VRLIRTLIHRAASQTPWVWGEEEEEEEEEEGLGWGRESEAKLSRNAAFLRTLRPSDEREQLATRLMEETRTGESGLAGLREATQLRWLEIQWEAWPAIL